MDDRSAITKENFDRLLAWLDVDREVAGKKYEQIRITLIKIFTWNGVTEAEDLADETINRVAKKVGEVSESYAGDPSRYFYGVAKYVLHEYGREQRIRVPLESLKQPDQESNTSEPEYECLSQCLEELPATSRRLIVSYYRKEKQSKIDHRKALARSFKLDMNSLRVRAARIRLTLERCIEQCLNRDSMMDE